MLVQARIRPGIGWVKAGSSEGNKILISKRSCLPWSVGALGEVKMHIGGLLDERVDNHMVARMREW